MHNHPKHDPYGTPTTLRFSRRMGESMRGAEYAEALHRTISHPRNRGTPFFLLVVVIAVGTVFCLLYV